MSKTPIDPPSFPLPTVEDRKMIFDDYLKIRRDRLRLPDGSPHSYYALVPPANAVNILAKTQDNKYILNLEYRHPTGRVLLGAPGGYMDPNETPEEAAKRELQEETGYRVDSLTMIGEAYPYPGISSQKIYYLYGEGAKKEVAPQREATELMHIVLMSEEDIREYIRAGQPIDGILCTGLCMLPIILSWQNTCRQSRQDLER